MSRKTMFAILPVALLLSTSLVFFGAALLVGKPLGYLIGFVFYWGFWCAFVPVRLTGRPFRSFFGNRNPLFTRRNWWVVGLLLSTVVAPLFMFFLPKVSHTPLPVIVLGFPLALVHATFEECLWRGMYVAEFPSSVFWAVIYPSLFFALWHIAPQFAISSGTPLLFALSTLPLGLTYAITAYVTRSATWSAIGHGISGVLAFSGLLSQCIYDLIRQW